MNFCQFMFVKKLKTSVTAKLLMAAVLIFSLQLYNPTSFAAELNPADNIKPSQSQPSLNNLREESTLIMDEKNIQKSTIKKNKTTLWSWLTKASKKPANFHYIDIIELFS